MRTETGPQRWLGAAILAVAVGLSGPVAPAVATATAVAPSPTSPAHTGRAPTYETHRYASSSVNPRSFQVRLVRRASGDAVAGATIRFVGNRRDGTRYRTHVVTNRRGVARWVLPVASSRMRYLEARYRAPGAGQTFLQLGLCHRARGWVACGAG